MRYPLSWLAEWLVLPGPAEDLARRLTARGFPVEGIARVGHDYPNVVVGRVLEVGRHPDADKLVLARVDVGAAAPLAIVCGAPNLRPGMKVPVALVGAELPGGLRIKRSKIRGATSEGMLCSARELELGGDHSGILDLREEAVVGRPVREIFGEPDALLDVEVAYNRPDVLSIAGLAREIAAAYDVPLAAGAMARFDATVATGGRFAVRVEDPEGCPRYLAQAIRGVTVAPSPPWLAERIERAGMRPVNNVVDVTNYVLLELGHPLHAFDRAALGGDEIVVRRARPGEGMTTLDGKARPLSPEHLLIADRARAACIAGVMGAAEVEVSAATTDVVLEAAWFDPYRIQRATSDHGLMSEAARRYGRGVDPNLAPAALARALGLILEVAGGHPDGAATDVRARTFEPIDLELRPSRVARLLGVRLGRERIARDLGALGFGVTDPVPGAGEAQDEVPMVVTVPTRRRDVTRPVDLIEEAARAFGYDKLPDVPLATGGSVGTRPPARRLRDRAREAMVGLGFSECVTPTLDDPARLAKTWPLLPRGGDEPRFVLLRNAAGPETSALRSDLVSGLIRVAAHHLRHGAGGLRLFEIGRVFAARAEGEMPEERWQLAAAMAGPRYGEAWDAAQGEVDFFDAKGAFESFLKRLEVDSADWRPYASRGWKSGEAAELRGKVHVACAGRLGPRLAKQLDVDVPLYLVVADFEGLARAQRPRTRFTPFSRLPAVTRDLAFFLPTHVPHATVETIIGDAGQPLLADVRLFDVYEGKGVPEGHKSLAYTLTFQAADRTLAEADVEAVQRAIVEALAAHAGATLRDR
jgi:phenylalanyl-tRNA synthetase beta chain